VQSLNYRSSWEWS